MKLILLQIACFGAVAFASPSDEEDVDSLPEGVETCSQADANLNECLKHAFQTMLPKLHNGLKSLNIPPVDPFSINNATYRYSNGAIQGRLALKNTKVYGMSNAKVEDVNLDILESGTQMDVKMFFPRIFIEGLYKAEVKINNIKMNPKGYFNVTMSAIKVTQKMEGTFQTSNGKRFLKLVKFDMDPEVGDMNIFATGLFPDPVLNSIVLDYVNQYWRDVYKMLLPETRVYWEPIMLQTMNQFLLRVPFDTLLPK